MRVIATSRSTKKAGLFHLPHGPKRRNEVSVGSGWLWWMSGQDVVLQFRGIPPLALACPFELQPFYPDSRAVLPTMRVTYIMTDPEQYLESKSAFYFL